MKKIILFTVITTLLSCALAPTEVLIELTPDQYHLLLEEHEVHLVRQTTTLIYIEDDPVFREYLTALYPNCIWENEIVPTSLYEYVSVWTLECRG